jgi:hypothetical protein
MELSQKVAKRLLKDILKDAIVNVLAAKRNTVNVSYKVSFVQIYVSVRVVRTVNKNLKLQHYLKTVEITSLT